MTSGQIVGKMSTKKILNVPLHPQRGAARVRDALPLGGARAGPARAVRAPLGAREGALDAAGVRAGVVRNAGAGDAAGPVLEAVMGRNAGAADAAWPVLGARPGWCRRGVMRPGGRVLCVRGTVLCRRSEIRDM